MNDKQTPDHPTPLSERTDEKIRDRARTLHEQDWVIEVPDDARVIRRGDDDTTLVEAWIHLGEED